MNTSILTSPRGLVSSLCLASLSLSLTLSFTSPLAAQDSAPAKSTPNYVWIEAEEPTTHANGRVETHEPESDYGKVLSNHALLRPNGEGAKLTATYEVEMPADGSYHVWVCKWWKHGPFKWRIDDGEWSEVSRDVVLHSSSFIMLHIGTNWIYMGSQDLAKGTHTLEIEGLDNGGFFDAFLLIDGTFQPAGRLKPGEKSGKAEEGYFAWEPDADTFGDDSAIDLRWLNEDYAGVNGYVKREGDHFVLGDGTPVRFWMTQADIVMGLEPPMLDIHARRLAKYGVNMARFGFMDEFKLWRSDKEAFKAKLDNVHRAVAALKKEGVYTFFGHLFWDTHVEATSDDDLPGLTKGERPIAALFVNEPLQEFYLEFVKAVMLPVNPYTGISLAEDPAVAIIEVQNESNALFWTLKPEGLAKSTTRLLQEGFAKFAAEKHGSLEKAFAHWEKPFEGDDADAGQAGIMPAWNLTSEGYSQHPKRAADQMEYLTMAQYNTYAKMKKAFHDMGIKKMVSGSNWKTADPSTLGALEHYSYTATDIVARNEYFGHEKVEDSRGHAVDLGDIFKPNSAMRSPQTAGPLMSSQQVDWPYMIIENNWDNPNPYRAEWPFLVATYGAMAGVDGWNFFAYDASLWINQMGVWSTNSPVVLGQYPAFALMFRRGDVKSGEPSVVEHLSPESLYQNDPVALPEIQYKDFVWKAELGGDPTVEFESEVDPRAFFAGPVKLDMFSGKKEVVTADLKKLIDDKAGIIHNTNGQLQWNFVKGHVLVNTATSQGITGFLKEAGKVAMTDLMVESQNDYGTVVAVSLDGKPLAQSGKILIQAMTEDKLYGYTTEEAADGALKITDLGAYPLNVKKIATTVTLRGLAGKKVTVLDHLGYPTDQPAQTRTEGSSLVITLPEDTLYTLVH